MSRELPILFSAPMVRAILEGRKTVTRRVIKAIPWRPGVNPNFSQARAFSNAGEFRIAGGAEMTTGFRCPYGRAGDRLWVREATHSDECTRPPVTLARYRADGELVAVNGGDDSERRDAIAHWRAKRAALPGIHMPKAWSRITLEVTDVRAERLQHVSANQAIREGLIQLPASGRYVVNAGEQYFGGASHDPREVFSWLWDGLAKPSARWDDNPWVWVVEFRRVEAPRADQA